MNKTLKHILQSNKLTKTLYSALREQYWKRECVKAASTYFKNIEDFRRALDQRGDGDVRLQTNDGLLIDIRPNYMDATILYEVFIDHCYAEKLKLSVNPVIIDVGGYIGDFAIYACKYLNAAKVITCEPSPSNLRLLRQNVTLNNYSDRVTIIAKAVTAGGDIFIDTELPPRSQARVSAYGTQVNPTRIPGITLEEIIQDNHIDHIDLLKVDCEGGEYEIFSTARAEVIAMIDHIVFEYHEIDGYESKLEAVKKRLSTSGFRLRTKGDLVFADRVQTGGG